MFLSYLLISFSFKKRQDLCKTVTTLHFCHKPASAVWPCKKCTVYMHVIMLMSIQLHDCPLWPSVVLTAIDQGRVSGARSGTSLWWIYQLLVQACSLFPDDRGDSSLLPRNIMWKFSYQLISRDKVGSVSQHSRHSTWKPSNFITVHRLIFSPSLQIIT